MLILAQAVYVVSVAEIVFVLESIWILVQAVKASCFQLHVVLRFVLSAKSFISKSPATYVVSVAEIVFPSAAICILVQAIIVSCLFHQIYFSQVVTNESSVHPLAAGRFG
jgi:hypothetical protein